MWFAIGLVLVWIGSVVTAYEWGWDNGAMDTAEALVRPTRDAR